MWKRACVLMIFACLVVVLGLPFEADVQDPGHYLNSFLIEVKNGDTAEIVAYENGFVLLEKLPMLNMYLLYHPEVSGRSKRSAEDYLSKLKQDPRVDFVEQQITLKRVKRGHDKHAVIHDKQLEFPIPEIKDNSKYYRVVDKFDYRGNLKRFNDLYYKDQWYLHNEEQTGGQRDIDLNVQRAWEMGFTGSGVVITILDDGIDYRHPDLMNNYDPDASADMNDKTDKLNDPTPDKSKLENSHGTRCAGEIAAEAGNGICGVGVAFKSKIGGIRILDGAVTDQLEAQALLYNNNHIDIYSASWGPHDDGATMEAPKRACAEALRKGVKTGRKKKGNIYVWATGNGGLYDDMCGADGYVSSIESISVQSLTDKGDLPFFGERCSSTMISVPTGGEPTQNEERMDMYKIKVVTTDIDGGCVENFEGTSSAAPLAAGCLALVLQANPDLGWRDVQHIVAKAARIPKQDEMWVINGADYHVNPKFGFGMMDCTHMVELAQTWENKPEQHTCETNEQIIERDITSSGCHKLHFNFNGCQDDPVRSITNLEHVQLHVKVTAKRRGNMEIFLTSPSGTRSELLSRRKNDDSTDSIDFLFMTVHSWMENPAGEWTLEVCDNPGNNVKTSEHAATFHSYFLRASGFHSENKQASRMAEIPSSSKVNQIINQEFELSRKLQFKRVESNTREKFPKSEQDVNSPNNKISKVSNLFSSRLFDNYYLQDAHIDNGHIANKEDREVANKEESQYEGRIMNEDGSQYDWGVGKNSPDVSQEDEEIVELKREMLDILGSLSASEQNYIEKFLQHKEVSEIKKRIVKYMVELNKDNNFGI